MEFISEKLKSMFFAMFHPIPVGMSAAVGTGAWGEQGAEATQDPSLRAQKSHR